MAEIDNTTDFSLFSEDALYELARTLARTVQPFSPEEETLHTILDELVERERTRRLGQTVVDTEGWDIPTSPGR